MSVELRRTLSLRDLIFITVGTVIGSGIFLTPGGVVRDAGSGGMALAAWIVGGASRPGEWWPARVSPTTVMNAVTAMIGVLWAYEGWQYGTFSAGETIDPQRIFARGLIAGTTLLVGIYVFANVGYLSALGVGGVASSNRVASDAAAAALGPAAGKLVAVVILVSIFSAANGTILTLPRLFFAMARDGVFFSRLAVVHPRLGTPVG